MHSCVYFLLADNTLMSLLFQGAGTDEGTLVEIICTKNNDEIQILKETYKEGKVPLSVSAHLSMNVQEHCNVKQLGVFAEQPLPR